MFLVHHMKRYVVLIYSFIGVVSFDHIFHVVPAIVNTINSWERCIIITFLHDTKHEEVK